MIYLDLHTSFSLDCYSNFRLNKRRHFTWFNASILKVIQEFTRSKNNDYKLLMFLSNRYHKHFPWGQSVEQVGKVAGEKPVEWFRPILPNKQWFVSKVTRGSFDTSNLKRDIAKLFPPKERTPSSQGVFLWVIKIRSTSFT